jgi:hypothetical protein
MSNPYFQVALTYLQRLFCSLARSLITSGIALLFFIGWFRQRHAFPPVSLFPFMALFAYWAIHVKGQFADSRASLTPGFRKVHGVVAIIVAVIFVIILPGVAAPLIGWQSLGFVSISTLLFGIILWFILRSVRTFFLLMSIGLLFIMHKPIWNRIEPIFSGKEPIQAFIIMSLGLILSITGIIRLFLLNEEKPEYHLNLIPKDGRGKLSGLQWQRWLRNRMAVGMIYHARHATDSYWSRMHRWGYSHLYIWNALLLAAYMSLMSKLTEFWSGGTFPSGIKIAFATMIPITMAIALAIAKKDYLSHELMMPVRRDAYLKQVGMLFANIQFTWWGMMIAVSIVDISTKAVKPGPELLIYSFFYSLMIQVLLFGLAIWIFSFRSINIVTPLIMLIAFIFSVRNIPDLERQVMFPWWSLILGALLACLGLLLTWWGYRRWLVADFN